jgi:hypothetical protein
VRASFRGSHGEIVLIPAKLFKPAAPRPFPLKRAAGLYTFLFAGMPCCVLYPFLLPEWACTEFTRAPGHSDIHNVPRNRPPFNALTGQVPLVVRRTRETSSGPPRVAGDGS